MVNAVSGSTPFAPTLPSEDKPQLKLIPGFDPAGQPLPDGQVWDKKIGRTGRPLNTAEGGIDGWEQRALLQAATKNPQEFLQRLTADSMNGTPVEFNFVRELDIGVLRVGFKADNGKFDTTATIDVFNKSVDGFLKPYLAQNARDKGARAKISLNVKGDLTKEGGVDNLQLEIKASNAPRLSAKKILELQSLEKDLKKALKADVSAKEKSERVLSIVNDAVEKLSDFPLPFLMKLIDDSDVIKAELTQKGENARATVRVGEGKYSVLMRDLIGKGKNEPDIRFSVSGRGSEDKDTLSVDEIRIFSPDKLAVSFGPGGEPSLSRINKKGEREAVNDHFAEAMVYLPMLLALAGDKSFF
jgi:hypothetical protein